MDILNNMEKIIVYFLMLTVLLKISTERILDDWWFGTKQTIQTNIFTLAGRSKLWDLGGCLCFVVNDSSLYTFPSSKVASIKFSAIISLVDLLGPFSDLEVVTKLNITCLHKTKIMSSLLRLKLQQRDLLTNISNLRITLSF